jgi:hypothetical protein
MGRVRSVFRWLSGWHIGLDHSGCPNLGECEVLRRENFDFVSDRRASDTHFRRIQLLATIILVISSGLRGQIRVRNDRDLIHLLDITNTPIIVSKFVNTSDILCP